MSADFGFTTSTRTIRASRCCSAGSETFEQGARITSVRVTIGHAAGSDQRCTSAQDTGGSAPDDTGFEPARSGRRAASSVG